MRGRRNRSVLLLLVPLLPALAFGQEGRDTPADTLVAARDTTSAATDDEGEPFSLAVKDVTPSRAGLGERIHVTVTHLSEAIDADSIDPGAFVLYLEGRPLAGHHPVRVDPSQNRMTFELRRTDASKQTWNALLGSPGGFTEDVRVGVGLTEGPELPPVTRDRPVTLELTILRPGWSLAMSVFLLGVLLAFVYYARRTNIIRDSVPPDPPPGEMRPYSLGRLQMATWFFVIIGSFLFVYAITGEYQNIITNQALVLMGIGIGTALGSSSIDQSKQNGLYQEIRDLRPKFALRRTRVQQIEAKLADASLAETTRSALERERSEVDTELQEIGRRLGEAQSNLSQPISEGFFSDLATDKDGVNLHRFQMLVWTGVLVILFIQGVYTNLAMPELDDTLLALMGISSGTYLGFKIPERQVEGT